MEVISSYSGVSSGVISIAVVKGGRIKWSCSGGFFFN